MKDKRIILVTKILVLNKTPKEIFSYMLNLNNNKYLKWHKDHLEYSLVKQTANGLGSVFYFDEKMGGKLRVKYKWELIEMETNKKLFTKAQSFIPIYLLLTFNKQAEGTLVTHELQIGYKKNKLINWVIKKIGFGSKNQKIVHEHAIEEFKNLEHLII